MKMDLNTTQSYTKSKTGAQLVDKADVSTIQKPVKGTQALQNSEPSSPDYKLDLKSKNIKPENTPEIKAEAPKVSSPNVETPKVDTPKIELPKLDMSVAKEEVKDVVKDKVIEDTGKTMFLKEVKDGSVTKPAIFFIKGLDIFSSPSKSERGYAGVGRMAESIEGSRIYGWGQKTEMLNEIKKIHPDYPVILVGHSLGGDTAVEIAEELDSLDYKFRPVDLLITLDAVGFKNDIIPQNVKNHLNIFGENDLFFNDGPHVARNHERTQVKNILVPDDHTDLDDSKNVQFEVVELIQKTIGKVS